MAKAMTFRCSCGRAFNFKYQLDNHIGMFILLNDNTANHHKDT